MTDFGAMKRAGVPISRSLNIRYRLKQHALMLRIEFKGYSNGGDICVAAQAFVETWKPFQNLASILIAAFSSFPLMNGCYALDANFGNDVSLRTIERQRPFCYQTKSKHVR